MTEEIKLVLRGDGQQAQQAVNSVRASVAQLGEAGRRSAADLRVGDASLRGMSMSAAQTAAAMRQVPMQVTDIVVGLASGQKPMMVLLQQGGQLKDTFGGIAPAAKALGGYLAAAVNPATLAAAAVATVATAWYKGRQEGAAYTQTLIQSGNAIGMTTAQLSGMAREMVAVTGTQASAAAGLERMAGSSRLPANALKELTEAAVLWERTTGQSVEATRGEFESLAKSPLEAMMKLNEGTNFVTEALYRQVRALVEEGRESEAAVVAQRAYAAALRERSGEIEASLGYVERAWGAAARAAKGAWDAMLGVGRPGSVADQVKAIDAEIAKLSSGDRLSNRLGITAWLGGGDSARLEALQQQKAALLELARMEEEGAAAKAASVQRTQALVAWDELRTKYADRQVQMEREIADARAKAVAAGAQSAELARIEGEIRKKYEDKGAASAAKAASRELQQQENLLARLSGLSNTFARDWERINERFAKGLITREQALELQKELLSQQPKIRDALKETADAEKQAAQAAREVYELRVKALGDVASETAGIVERAKAIEQETELIGLSTRAVELITRARRDEQIAALDRRIEMLADTSTTIPGYIEQLERQREALVRLRDAEAGRADRARNAAAMPVYNRSAQEAVAEWRRTSDQVGQAFAQSIMDGGKSAADQLTRLFSGLVLTPVVQAVMQPAAQGITAALGVGSSAVGNVGLLPSLSNIVSGTSAAYSALYGQFATSGVGASLGLSAPFTEALFGGPAVTANMMTGFGSALGTALPYLGISALLLSSIFKKGGGPKDVGRFASDDATAALLGERWTTNFADTGAFGADAASIATQLQDSVATAAKNLGGTGIELPVALVYDMDPKGKAQNQVRAAIGSAEVYSQYGRTEAELQAGIVETVQRLLLAGLQQSQLPAQIADVLDDVNAATASAEEIQAALAAAESMRGLLKVTEALRLPVTSVTDAMIKAGGGTDALQSAMASYYELTRSDEEKLADLRASVAQSFAELGQALPASVQDFRALVEGIDTSTEAGQTLYGQLVGLTGAMRQLDQASKGLATTLDETIGRMTGRAAAAVEAAKGWPTADDWIGYARATGDTDRLARSLKVSIEEAWTRLDVELPPPASLQDYTKVVANLDVLAQDSLEWAGKLVGALKLADEFAELDQALLGTADAVAVVTNQLAGQIGLLTSMRSLMSDADYKARVEPLLQAQLNEVLGTATALPTNKQAMLDLIDGVTDEDIKRRIVDDVLPTWDALYNSVAKTSGAARSAGRAFDSAAQQMSSAMESLAQYVQGLSTSELALNTPAEQLRLAEAAYRETVARAETKDVEAIQDLRGVSDVYIRALQGNFGSTTRYFDEFGRIVETLGRIAGVSTPGASTRTEADPRMLELQQRTLRELERISATARERLRMDRLDAGRPRYSY